MTTVIGKLERCLGVKVSRCLGVWPTFTIAMHYGNISTLHIRGYLLLSLINLIPRQGRLMVPIAAHITFLVLLCKAQNVGFIERGKEGTTHWPLRWSITYHARWSCFAACDDCPVDAVPSGNWPVAVSAPCLHRSEVDICVPGTME